MPETVVLIDHDRRPRPCLVATENPDKTLDLVFKTNDAKLHKHANGAEWWRAFERITHVESFASKLKAWCVAENEKAVAEGRNANHPTTAEVEGLLQQSWALAGHIQLTIPDGDKDGLNAVVSHVHLLASEEDEIPAPYRKPKPELVESGTVAGIQRTDIPAPAPSATGAPMTPAVINQAKEVAAQPGPTGKLTEPT